MPVDLDFADTQLERFRTFPSYPRRIANREPIAEYLAQLSRDEDHCRTICDRLLESCRRFPLPADIRAAAYAEQAAIETTRCHKCRDSGWIDAGGFAKRCDCTGQRMRTLAAEEVSEAYDRETRKRAGPQEAPLPDPLPMHPELAVGIPPLVVAAKPAFRAKYAEKCAYLGPLTLQAAIDAGMISYRDARNLVADWERVSRQKFQGACEEPAVRKPLGVAWSSAGEKIS